MKHFGSKIYLFLGIVAIIIVGTSLLMGNFSLFVLEAATPTEIPQEIQPCLPKLGKDVFSLAIAQTIPYEKKIYYRVNVEENVYPFPESPLKVVRDTIVFIDDIGCQVAVPREDFFERTLEDSLPLELARRIELNRVEQEIANAGGRKKYIASLTQSPFFDDLGDSEYYYFFPEFVWVLKQLHIPIPQPYKIIRSKEEIGGNSRNKFF